MPEIYVNPSCSKCRSALEILDELQVSATEVRYLEAPPGIEDLRRLMTLFSIDDPRLMVRRGEDLYSTLELDSKSDDELLRAISEHPILLERPIFVAGERAVIARPPEKLLELLVEG